jgi:hypothetical protein
MFLTDLPDNKVNEVDGSSHLAEHGVAIFSAVFGNIFYYAIF